MTFVKKILRGVVLPATLKLGVDKYFLSKGKKKCCIVNFHGVRNSSSEVFNNRHMDVVEFEKTIKYLKKRYNIVPLAEIFDIHRSKNYPAKRTIALTFDDGYLNNFKLALPVLRKYNVFATFYLISNGLKERDFYVWPDKIDLMRKYFGKDISIGELNFKHPLYKDISSKIDILEYLKQQGGQTVEMAEKISAQFSELKEIISKNPELMELVKEDELKQYKDEKLIEFGSHTHTHPNLEYLNKELATNELKVSKQIIEDIIGKKVISLAFPDGSYNSETISIATELGYTNLVAVDYKLNEDNKHANILSRFTISNSTTFESNVVRLAKDFEKYGF